MGLAHFLVKLPTVGGGGGGERGDVPGHDESDQNLVAPGPHRKEIGLILTQI